MEFLQILDAGIAPGGLVEWVPSTPGGLGMWHRDPRPTSHNHELHLRSAFEYRARTRREGGRESWLGLTVEFDGPPAFPAIRSALVAWINRHEVLRTHVVLKASGTERYTTDAGTVRLKMSRIGWFADSSMLTEQIAGSFDRATAPLHWPAYRFATVTRPHSFTLLFAADHSLVDGYSLINAQHELRELYQAALDGRPADLPPVGSYVEFSGAERQSADGADESHPAVGLWTEYLSGDRPLPRFELLTEPPKRGDDDPPPAQPSTSALLFDDAQTVALEEYFAAADGSLAGGLLAAMAVVYHRRSGAAEFACLMPRHTRVHADLHGALGWFVSVAPIAVRTDDDPDLDQCLERAMRSLDEARRGASLPMLRLAELADFTPHPKFVVSYMDTRRVPGAADADAGAARVLRSHSYSDDEVYVWLNRTPAGLRMHARYPADEPGRPRSDILRGYLNDVAALLASTPERPQGV
ncbi:MAG: condensation domain-containing protein [Gordonia sp. (in: high G+C Gram-positive bacteria)]